MHWPETKGERRERKSKNRRKMKVAGRGVRDLQRIIVERANGTTSSKSSAEESESEG